MADSSKHITVHGGRPLVSELKAFFHILKTKRSVKFVYGFMFGFIVLTIVLAFKPSFNPDAPSYTNIYSNSYRSQFSSLFSHFFNPNSSNSSTSSSSQVHDFPGHSDRSSESSIVPDKVPRFNQTQSMAPSSIDEEPIFMQNQTKAEPPEPNFNESTPVSDKVPILNQTQLINSTNIVKEEALSHANNASSTTSTSVETPVFQQNHSTTHVPETPVSSNQTENSPPKPSVPAKNTTADALKSVADKAEVSASLSRKQNNNGTKSGEVKKKQGKKNMVESLMKCDLFDGNWVMDDSYPLYKDGSCSFIDEQFNCVSNGRPDKSYQKMKWKPKGCDLPRLNGRHMLEIMRGKRLVFVGDSLNRNMWESLVCILKGAVKNKKNVYEANGRSYFRGEASYSFIFKDYNSKVEFFVSPFLVREWEMPDKNGTKKETLRLDLVGKFAGQYKDADFIIFNTGHWWTHEKTSLGKDYYQEGNHVYNELNVLEAFRKALTTWGRWVDANINPMKSLVFFRGYSASHFFGGQWNSGGQCDNETEPIKNDKYLTEYPPKMIVLEKVLKGMKTPVTYLNITRMTDYRKDAHPSIYRKQHLSEEERKSPLRFQDCSHWCLPGVPDAWNELLYAELLVKLNKKQT